MAKELSKKQRILVDSYAEGMSKLAAMRMAGYSDPVGNLPKIFDSPTVQAAIAERQASTRKRHDIKVDDVIEGLMEAVHAASNSQELVGAWREIGRIIGAYEHAKKIEVDVKAEVKHIESTKQLERMTEKQLAELADLGDNFIVADALGGDFVEDSVEDDIEDAEYEEID